MTIWIIGYMFTWGLFLDDKGDDESWWQAIKTSLCFAFLWPILLGIYVSGAWKDMSEEGK